MYTIPEDINLQILNGAIVQQICFTMNTVGVFFEDKGYIQIEGNYILKQKEASIHHEVYPAYSNCDILKLLERKVAEIYVQEKNLIIKFDDDFLLEII